MKQTAVSLLKETLDSEIKSGTKMVVNWDMYLEMEKKQIIDAINNVSENNVKYANKIISSISPIEGELFTHNKNLAENYYNETYGSKGSDETN